MECLNYRTFLHIKLKEYVNFPDVIPGTDQEIVLLCPEQRRSRNQKAGMMEKIILCFHFPAVLIIINIAVQRICG